MFCIKQSLPGSIWNKDRLSDKRTPHKKSLQIQLDWYYSTVFIMNDGPRTYDTNRLPKYSVFGTRCKVQELKYNFCNITPREKGFWTIPFNYHVTFPSSNLEKPGIFQDISMNFHENFYREIKAIQPTGTLGLVLKMGLFGSGNSELFGK